MDWLLNFQLNVSFFVILSHIIKHKKIVTLLAAE